MRNPRQINADINAALSSAIRLIVLAQIVAVGALLALPVVKQGMENIQAYNTANEVQ